MCWRENEGVMIHIMLRVVWAHYLSKLAIALRGNGVIASKVCLP